MVRIGLTMGDAAGIGPELLIGILNNKKWDNRAEFILYGAEEVINYNCELFKKPMVQNMVNCSNLKMSDFTIAQASPACGLAAFDTLTTATQDAIAGKIDAIVTAPMNKLSVNMAGIDFTGHTERIAELCGVDSFAMMQSSGSLRVVFVTTHIALNEVAEACTAERIAEVAKLLQQACYDEGITQPKLACAAINPHAGEKGYMGKEDELVVKPILAELNSNGYNIEGPFPPDTLFIEKIRTQFDGIISMYHDQGHIPFKMLAFDSGVNSTLGLPIIRTSVDHGTAFEIAYQGIADRGSMEAAVELAIIRAENRQKRGVL